MGSVMVEVWWFCDCMILITQHHRMAWVGKDLKDCEVLTPPPQAGPPTSTFHTGPGCPGSPSCHQLLWPWQMWAQSSRKPLAEPHWDASSICGATSWPWASLPSWAETAFIQEPLSDDVYTSEGRQCFVITGITVCISTPWPSECVQRSVYCCVAGSALQQLSCSHGLP